jgi:hypothetical protein
VTGLPRLPEPPFRRAVLTTPADRAGARVDCFPAHAAFPKWPEGRHPHCHFRGLLELHSRRIAQSPKATFVTRLQPCRLPSRAARQLPDQSTILRVESSSTDDSRLRGARPLGDIAPALLKDETGDQLRPPKRKAPAWGWGAGGWGFRGGTQPLHSRYMPPRFQTVSRIKRPSSLQRQSWVERPS